MNTLSIDPRIWEGAETYARTHHISMEKLIEHALRNILGEKKETFRLKQENELSPEIRSLIGCMPTTNDCDGKEARMEYIQKKHMA